MASKKFAEHALDRVVEAMKRVPSPVGDFQSYTREQARAALAEVAAILEDEHKAKPQAQPRLPSIINSLRARAMEF